MARHRYRESSLFPHSVFMSMKKTWRTLFSGRSLANMDEVARGLGLAVGVCFKIPVHAVLQFAVESIAQQGLEAFQAMRIIGQTEFTADKEQYMHKLGFLKTQNIREVTVPFRSGNTI